jgi:hypothetical protein
MESLFDNAAVHEFVIIGRLLRTCSKCHNHQENNHQENQQQEKKPGS